MERQGQYVTTSRGDQSFFIRTSAILHTTHNWLDSKNPFMTTKMYNRNLKENHICCFIKCSHVLQLTI